MARRGAANPLLRQAWRGMSRALGVSGSDMYAILASLRGAHARHALALRSPEDVQSAWDTTKRVLRIASHWLWVQNEWPLLGGGHLERWIAERDMALGVPREDSGWRRPPTRRPEAVASRAKSALMILADACEEAARELEGEGTA